MAEGPRRERTPAPGIPHSNRMLGVFSVPNVSPSSTEPWAVSMVSFRPTKNRHKPRSPPNLAPTQRSRWRCPRGHPGGGARGPRVPGEDPRVEHLVRPSRGTIAASLIAPVPSLHTRFMPIRPADRQRKPNGELPSGAVEQNDAAPHQHRERPDPLDYQQRPTEPVRGPERAAGFGGGEPVDIRAVRGNAGGGCGSGAGSAANASAASRNIIDAYRRIPGSASRSTCRNHPPRR